MDLDRKTAYLLLGSNLGDSSKLIKDAILLIGERTGHLKAQSSYYQTAAWGNTDQPDFINVAVELDTNLSASVLLNEVLAIEKDLGRVRHEKWGARLIDIDIIFYGDEIIDLPDLKIPHPEMQHRKFVLEPLKEIASGLIHPITKTSIFELLSTLNDSLAVVKSD